MGMSTAHWLEAYAAKLGVAAHAAQRSAAPVSCYLVARAGVTPGAALAAAEELAAGHDAETTRSDAE